MEHLRLSDGEWKLMKTLWQRQPRTLAELVAALDTETGHVVLCRVIGAELREIVFIGKRRVRLFVCPRRFRRLRSRLGLRRFLAAR